MVHNFAGMEVVASGTSNQVKCWTELLVKARVPFAVTQCCDESKNARSDHAELWVEREKVDDARSAIQNAVNADASLLW